MVVSPLDGPIQNSWMQWRHHQHHSCCWRFQISCCIGHCWGVGSVVKVMVVRILGVAMRGVVILVVDAIVVVVELGFRCTTTQSLLLCSNL